MSHVDDGELTAYADGAYPVNDPEALRISAHLSTCGNCRTRLEQSQELRSRAAEILAFATPASLTAPSFESLQTQAVTTSHKNRPAIPLAWAATIVLALGIGWFGRGAWQFEQPTARRSISSAAQDATVPTVAQEEAQPLETQTAAPAPAAAGARDLSRRAANSNRQLAEADQTELKRTEDAAADVAIGSTAGRAAIANAPAAAAPPPPVASVEQAERREAVSGQRSAVADLQYLTAAEAERRGLNVPRIPELPIARIGIASASTVIEQTLPDGKLITLTVMQDVSEGGLSAVQKTTTATPPSRAAVPQAAAGAAANREFRAQAVSTVTAGRRITVTGNVSADSLRVLLGKVKVVE